MGKSNEGSWKDKQAAYEGARETPWGSQAHVFALGAAALPENQGKDAAAQAWVVSNLAPLAELSSAFYQHLGRSGILVRFDADGNLAGDPEPVTPLQLRQSRTRESARLIQADIAAYDPQRDVVVAAVLPDGGRETTWVYKVRAT